MKQITFVAAAAISLFALTAGADADIFQWEYIDPADPSQGKRQSTTLAPDGAGVDAVPGANLYSRDLSKAYLIRADLYVDLSRVLPIGAYLAGTNLSRADLTNANLQGATLTDADLTDANVRGTIFDKYIYICGFGQVCFPGIAGRRFGTGIMLGQLYSTSSYKDKDLTGISLYWNDLAEANFAGQNLTAAVFDGANLTGADFRQANLANAYLEANLSNSDLRAANLANASFDRDITCYFDCSPFTLDGADFTAADARGAIGLKADGATVTNLILPDGHINGLDLDVGGHLTVRDYDGNPSPIPITVDQHLVMGPGGTLQMVFEADAWDSTISFAPGIPVTLGGTLELTFANDVNLASQLGRTFDLFDWTDVDPTGVFAVASPYRWDTSNLYTTGQVTLTAIPEPTTLLLIAVAAALRIRRRPLNAP